jgi:hypothetical protein
VSHRLKLRRAAVVSAALAVLLVPSATPAAADTICSRFAARSGSDANPGTETAPKLTVQALVDSLGSGETGCLRGGTYPETSNGYVARVTTPGVTLRSAPGERARIVGIVYVLSSAAGMHLSDLDVEGTGGSNTVKVYAPDVVVERNTITNAHRGLSCMMLGSNSGAGQATRVVVRGNVLSACGSPANANKDHAIYAANVDGGEIVENVISDPSAYAIQLYPNAHHTRFAHNVVDGGASIRGGVIFGGDTSFASTDNLVEDNVLAYAASYALSASWGGATGTGNVARSNCVFGAGAGAVGSTAGWVDESLTVADPRFVDRAAGDYRLAAGSPCLSVVGYDTARLIAGESAGTADTVPAATPTPAPVVAEEPPPAANAPPAVQLTSPRDGATAPLPLLMTAVATDDDAVTRVEFHVDGKLVGTDSTAPYSVSVGRLHSGWHRARVRAYDAAGLSTASDRVSFLVGGADAGKKVAVTASHARRGWRRRHARSRRVSSSRSRRARRAGR